MNNIYKESFELDILGYYPKGTWMEYARLSETIVNLILGFKLGYYSIVLDNPKEACSYGGKTIWRHTLQDKVRYLYWFKWRVYEFKTKIK